MKCFTGVKLSVITGGSILTSSKRRAGVSFCIRFLLYLIVICFRAIYNENRKMEYKVQHAKAGGKGERGFMNCPTAYEPADISIYIQGRGMVLKEKSVMAFQKSDGKILAYGTEAEQLAGKNTAEIEVTSPLRRGMVADYCVAAKLFALLITKALGKEGNSSLLRNRKCLGMVVCVPQGITEVEKKALEDLMRWEVRAKKVLIVDIPAEEFIRMFSEKYPDEYGKYKIIVSIAKDEPERYVEELLRDVLKFAGQKQISGEKVCGLLQEQCRSSIQRGD